MRSLRQEPMWVRVWLWFVMAVVCGVAGVVVLGRLYDEFLDCSNPEIHERANTPLGWSVAVIASIIPVAVAIRLAGRVRHRLVLLAVAAAALALATVWPWVLDPRCEWY